MASIRLEKFAYVHHAEPGARLVSADEIDAIQKEAFEAGIRDGATAASDAFSTEQYRCLSRIQEAIGDTFFAREEAHRLALMSLKPMIESLAKAIAPALSSTGLSAEISRIAEDAAIRAPEDLLVISVPFGLGEEITELLKRVNSTASVSEDASLSTAQAKVNWSGGFDLIDLEATSVAAIDAIDGFFAEIEQVLELDAHHAN